MIKLVVSAWVLLATSVLVFGGEVLYSYRADGLGGLARVVIDEQSGRLVSHARLVEDARLASAHKIGIDSARSIAVVVNESERDAGLWVVDLKGDREAEFVALPAMPDAVCVSAGAAHIGLDNGRIASVDLESRRQLAMFNPRRELSPPGQKPESIVAVPSRGVILVSFQKDHRAGERKGNRIVVLRERTLELVADVELPRSMPELHNPTTPKEQGPGPEVIAVCERTGSVLVTIDFYGALLPLQLDDVLAGRTGEAVYHSAAVDGSFGHSFPDRLVTLGDERSHIAVVLNSGLAGGGLVIDFAEGAVRHRFDVPHGLEPVGPIADGRVFAAHAGKVKMRAQPEVEKRYAPRAVLTELIIESDGVRVRHHDAPAATHLAAIATAGDVRLLVVMGDERDRLGLFAVDSGFDLPLHRAFGAVERVASLP